MRAGWIKQEFKNRNKRARKFSFKNTSQLNREKVVKTQKNNKIHGRVDLNLHSAKNSL